MVVVCDHRYPGTREEVILVVTVPPIAADTPSPTPSELVGATAERRRTELADFLRKRRAVIKPEDVGLPNGGRRRTPGLRREEVAQLAGVGTTWYTWLEQGRDVRASLDVLEALSRAVAPGQLDDLGEPGEFGAAARAGLGVLGVARIAAIQAAK